MANDRPRRRAIPVRVKKAVCKRQKGLCTCGCGQTVSWLPNTGTKFDHRPPLRLRNISADGLDYDPHQHSADHIDAVCAAEHDRRTFRGGGGARADSSSIARERRAEKDRAGIIKPKARWATRPMGQRPPGAGNGFPPRGSTPMRRKP